MYGIELDGAVRGFQLHAHGARPAEPQSERLSLAQREPAPYPNGSCRDPMPVCTVHQGRNPFQSGPGELLQDHDVGP